MTFFSEKISTFNPVLLIQHQLSPTSYFPDETSDDTSPYEASREASKAIGIVTKNAQSVIDAAYCNWKGPTDLEVQIDSFCTSVILAIFSDTMLGVLHIRNYSFVRKVSKESECEPIMKAICKKFELLGLITDESNFTFGYNHKQKRCCIAFNPKSDNLTIQDQEPLMLNGSNTQLIDCFADLWGKFESACLDSNYRCHIRSIAGFSQRVANRLDLIKDELTRLSKPQPEDYNKVRHMKIIADLLAEKFLYDVMAGDLECRQTILFHNIETRTASCQLARELGAALTYWQIEPRHVKPLFNPSKQTCRFNV